MKKKVMNIRPQEVTVGGERSVQYKGSDGKMHDIAAAAGETDGGSDYGALIVNATFDGNEGIADKSSNEVFAALNQGKNIVYKITSGQYNVIIMGGLFNIGLVMDDNEEQKVLTIPTPQGFNWNLGDVIVHHHFNVRYDYLG